ncbi:hypothetical protein ACV9TN_002954 [Listeria monocytogenes]|nr:hypothetical protein [Listeria monocytogenes]EAD4868888.1 hypothetical protein [Listeria monocytogenes]EAE1330998.1 hypothetical protein [Listeria monocytogenes]EAE9169151.1 hypothetical protein [Listeria monocytogenes]EAF2350644.1 hypothetical protein [Listeria monocytogenes]
MDFPIQNLEELKTYLASNLLTKTEARAITKQSQAAFNQSIQTGTLNSFYEKGEHQSKVRLFLKEECETYARNKKNAPKN